MDQNEKRLKLLEYKSIDAEARNRRHNLILRGFPDTLGEEDCEAKVKKKSWPKNWVLSMTCLYKGPTDYVSLTDIGMIKRHKVPDLLLSVPE